MLAIVYMATNQETGARYIGATSKTLKEREASHWYRVRSRDDRGIFTAALRRHDQKTFKWEVLATYADHEAAYEGEKFFIKLISPEYNISGGGKCGLIGARRLPVSEETRVRLRDVGLQNKDRWAKYAALGPLSMQRRVRCLDDGLEYESIKDAANAYGVARSALNELCLGQRGRKTVGGLRFEFA